MCDILDDLRAYLAGENSVVMSPSRIKEMIEAFDTLRAEVKKLRAELALLKEPYNGL